MTNAQALAEWGDLLVFIGHQYPKSDADWQGTVTESPSATFRCRFSYSTPSRTRSATGEDRHHSASVILLDDVPIHESDRITVEGIFQDDGLELVSFEVTSVTIAYDEYGKLHHQTVRVRGD
jgi:hypothetical protein